jgi:zinc and cadmium transporter
MFFLQRIFHFHTHEVWDGSEDQPADAPSPTPSNSLPVVQGPLDHIHGPECNHGPHDHAHSHQHGHDHHGHDHMFPTGSWTWAGVFFGLALHSLIDGLALGAAIQAEGDEHSAPLFAGIGYFLAVFLHKPFDSISITSLMHMTGWSRKSCNYANWIYAFVAPLGVLIFFLTTGVAGNTTGWMGGMLAFAAGACVCIATSDLLPELQFHSHDRLRLSIALIAGLAMAWALVFIESQGHDHHNHGKPAVEQINDLHKDHGHKH